jgi:hypothetical protein
MPELHVFLSTLSNSLSATQGLGEGASINSKTDIICTVCVCVCVFLSSVFTADEDEFDYVGILNRALPEDIRVLGWCPVPPGFNARYLI